MDREQGQCFFRLCPFFCEQTNDSLEKIIALRNFSVELHASVGIASAWPQIWLLLLARGFRGLAIQVGLPKATKWRGEASRFHEATSFDDWALEVLCTWQVHFWKIYILPASSHALSFVWHWCWSLVVMAWYPWLIIYLLLAASCCSFAKRFEKLRTIFSSPVESCEVMEELREMKEKLWGAKSVLGWMVSIFFLFFQCFFILFRVFPCFKFCSQSYCAHACGCFCCKKLRKIENEV